MAWARCVLHWWWELNLMKRPWYKREQRQTGWKTEDYRRWTHGKGTNDQCVIEKMHHESWWDLVKSYSFHKCPVLGYYCVIRGDSVLYMLVCRHGASGGHVRGVVGAVCKYERKQAFPWVVTSAAIENVEVLYCLLWLIVEHILFFMGLCSCVRWLLIFFSGNGEFFVLLVVMSGSQKVRQKGYESPIRGAHNMW